VVDRPGHVADFSAAVVAQDAEREDRGARGNARDAHAVLGVRRDDAGHVRAVAVAVLRRGVVLYEVVAWNQAALEVLV
jgi:hypothetical protein